MVARKQRKRLREFSVDNRGIKNMILPPQQVTVFLHWGPTHLSTLFNVASTV